jgi:hypothetical protein
MDPNNPYGVAENVHTKTLMLFHAHPVQRTIVHPPILTASLVPFSALCFVKCITALTEYGAADKALMVLNDSFCFPLINRWRTSLMTVRIPTTRFLIVYCATSDWKCVNCSISFHDSSPHCIRRRVYMLINAAVHCARWQP